MAQILSSFLVGICVKLRPIRVGCKNLGLVRCTSRNILSQVSGSGSRYNHKNTGQSSTLSALGHGHAHTFQDSFPRGHTVRLYSSETGPSKSDSKQTSRRNRILAYVGGFILIHLTVLFARRQRKKSQEMTYQDQSEMEFQEYKDPDFKQPMYYYKDYLFPFYVKDSAAAVQEFKVNEEDVIVSSFPKSGTTWLQEIIYLIERGVDDKSASEQNLEQRFPYLEFIYPGIKEIAKQEGQRLLKTHMPLSLLPAEARAGKGKIIYIARNPKDVSVSYYYYLRMMAEVAYDGTFKKYFDNFVNDKVAYGPWWKHVLEYWNHRDADNFMFLTYEELQQDLTGSIEKLAKFLGKDLTSVQVAAVAGRCSFRAMKANPATNYSWWDTYGLRRKGETEFMRKGVVGDWKNHYSTEMAEKIDEVCKKKLEPSGLKFVDSVN